MTIPQSRLLMINSDDRDSGTHNNFRVSINNYRLDRTLQLSLTGATFLNSEFNIKTGFNTFSYEVDATPYSVVIPIGQYSSTELIAYLDANAPTLTTTLTANSNFFQFVTSGTDLSIFGEASGTTMFRILGITQDNTASGNTKTADTIPNLSGLALVNVSSNALGASNSISSDSNHAHIISTVPVPNDVDFGERVTYNSDTTNDLDNITYLTEQNIRNIDIQLLDQDLNECQLQTNIVLVFKIIS